MITQADIVVIGSGALGASTAFHLARAGSRSVALLDQHEIASQTSPRAAGLTSQIRHSDLMTRLAMRAVRKIVEFEAETGEKLEFFQPGALKIARIPAHVEQLQREVARARQLGLPLDLISPAEAKAKMPFLETTGILAVTYSPTDLYLEPVQIPAGYARAAARHGAHLLPNTRVTGIATKGGAVERVITDQGEIACSAVVDAAGGWLRHVASLAGGRAPMVPTRHQLLITEPLPGVRTDLPITRVIDANVYVRPDKGGLMLGGYEANPVQYDAAQLPPGFDLRDLELDLDVLRGLAAKVREQLPVFARLGQDVKLREHRGGLPTMTADAEHSCGPVPGVRGLFAIGGCNVGGLSIAPALGEALAEWVLRGEPPMDLSRLAPARHGADLQPESRLREACRIQYAHHYWEDVPELAAVH